MMYISINGANCSDVLKLFIKLFHVHRSHPAVSIVSGVGAAQ